MVAAFDRELTIEHARMPPASWYRDPSFAELERVAVFDATWQYVGPADDVREPGAWVGGCDVQTPWLVTRDREGVLRAHHNSCRHKATPLAMGRGVLDDDELTCPYHGWRYSLDGRLKRAPQAGRMLIDREELRLPEMAVERWGPLVLRHRDLRAPSLASQVPEIHAALTASGWERLRHHTRREYHLSCNWKVFADNYLDGGYHIAHMHPTLDAQLDMSTYRTQVFARSSLQTCSASTTGAPGLDVDPAERIGAGALYAFIQPNLMINRYGPALDINFVVPTGPETCRVVFDFWFDPEVEGSEAFVASSVAQADVTQQEDIAISEMVQVGLRGGTYVGGPYAPRFEIGEHHFHRLLSRDLEEALDRGA
jgi:choline monooxygenase